MRNIFVRTLSQTFFIKSKELIKVLHVHNSIILFDGYSYHIPNIREIDLKKSLSYTPEGDIEKLGSTVWIPETGERFASMSNTPAKFRTTWHLSGLCLEFCGLRVFTEDSFELLFDRKFDHETFK